MIDLSRWILQYPSGTEENGMLSVPATINNKYFVHDREKNILVFSLSADEKGKSEHGSSVRSELMCKDSHTLKGSHFLFYKALINSDNIDKATFTVGQILMKCKKKDSPLCRIEISGGRVEAVIKNYKEDGIETTDGKTWKYELGKIASGDSISIGLCIKDSSLSVNYNGHLAVKHIFPSEVSNKLIWYFKIGLYYQCTGPIMTQVQISECGNS